MAKLTEDFHLIDTHTGKVVSSHQSGKEALKAEFSKNWAHKKDTGSAKNRYRLASEVSKGEDGSTKVGWARKFSSVSKPYKPPKIAPYYKDDYEETTPTTSSKKKSSSGSSFMKNLGKHLLKRGISSLFEDEVPVNNAGDGNIAGIDTNPPVKKKKLRDVLRRSPPDPLAGITPTDPS